MTAPSIDRDPPAWATALARHRDGLRKLIRSLLEEEAGRPMWPLDALLAAIPQDERVMLLFDLRAVDDAEFGALSDQLIAGQIDRIVYAYETHVAAAYQHGPHLGRWQDATRSADEAIGQHGAEAIEAITEEKQPGEFRPDGRDVCEVCDDNPHLRAVLVTEGRLAGQRACIVCRTAAIPVTVVQIGGAA